MGCRQSISSQEEADVGGRKGSGPADSGSNWADMGSQGNVLFLCGEVFL